MNYLGHWVVSTFQNNNLNYDNSKLKGDIEELEDENKRLTQDLQRKEKVYRKQIEELKEENRRLTQELQKMKLDRRVVVDNKPKELQKKKPERLIVEPKEVMRETTELTFPKPISIRLRDYFGIRGL